MQKKAVERQKALEAEASLLRQAFSRRAGGAEDAYAERCRQAEKLLAQQVRKAGNLSRQQVSKMLASAIYIESKVSCWLLPVHTPQCMHTHGLACSQGLTPYRDSCGRNISSVLPCVNECLDKVRVSRAGPGLNG